MIITDTSTNMYVVDINRGFVSTHKNIEYARDFKTIKEVYDYIAKNDTADTIRLGIYTVSLTHRCHGIIDYLAPAYILNDIPPYEEHS